MTRPTPAVEPLTVEDVRIESLALECYTLGIQPVWC